MKKLIVVLSLLSSYAFASKNIELKNAQKMMQKSSWAFEENKGQVTGADGKNVKFVFKDGNLSMFLMQSGIAYQFHKVTYPDGYKPLDKFASIEVHEKMEKLQSQIQTETYRMDVILEGANQNPKISTEGKSNDYIQYYNHNALDVRSYQKVTYYEVYPHIDWVVYINKNAGNNEPKVKYDFVVHPGGDPSQIKLKTEWVEELTSNDDGSIAMKNRMGSVTEQRPVSFQEGKEVKTNFVVKSNIINFQLSNYDINKDIVIDPGLLWGTFYGGGAEDNGNSCATDSSENVYMAGTTSSSINIASGGHQLSSGGYYEDAFLVKFNSAGIRQWATYYGGNKTENGNSCAVDGSGNVYLAGRTLSSTAIASGGHQNTYGGLRDAFLVKFNSAGVRQWATYYGGGDNDYGGYSCAVDGSGNVYLAGQTNSTSGIASGGHQNTLGGETDAFLVKFNSAGVRQWATYYGGYEYDEVNSCIVDGSGNVYLAGWTNSPNNIAFNGHKDSHTHAGGADAFIIKFNKAGIRQWGTYYGEIDDDEWGCSCAVDSKENVYLTCNNETIGMFFSKFDKAGKRQWEKWESSLGGYVTYCTTDASGNLYLSGYSNQGIPLAFLIKYNSFGTRQWTSFITGAQYNGMGLIIGKSCAIDGKGKVYLVGSVKNYKLNLSTTIYRSGIGYQDVGYGDITSGGHQPKVGASTISTDAFLLKLDNINSYIFSKTACGSYYWKEKNRTYTSNNNNDTIKLTNINGFDSIVTLNLTIYPNPIPTIINTGNDLSTQTYNTYQWLNNGTNISGAVQQSYNATSNGSYQVEVTDTNNCKGISASLNVIVSSLNEVDKDYFQIYPNPSERMLHIETNEPENWQAIITDMKGSQINQMQFNKSTQLDISSYAPGVYYIQLTNNENVLNYKFIKK